MNINFEERIKSLQLHDQKNGILGDKVFKEYLDTPLIKYFKDEPEILKALETNHIHTLNDLRLYQRSELGLLVIDKKNKIKKLHDEKKNVVLCNIVGEKIKFFDEYTNPKTGKQWAKDIRSSVTYKMIAVERKKPETVWKLIDKIAEEQQLSTSILARNSGLDQSSFTAKRRINGNGKCRKPSLTSLIKVFDYIGKDLSDLPDIYFLGADGKSLKKILAERGVLKERAEAVKEMKATFINNLVTLTNPSAIEIPEELVPYLPEIYYELKNNFNSTLYVQASPKNTEELNNT